MKFFRAIATRHRWRIQVISVFALLVFAAGLLITSGRHHPQSRTIPHRGEITIRKVSYGKEHLLRVGSWWQNFAATILPRRINEKLGIAAAVIDVSTLTNTTVVFIETKITNSGPPSASRFLTTVFPRISHSHVMDELGNEFPVHPMSPSPASLPTNIYALSRSMLGNQIFAVSNNTWIDVLEIPAEWLSSPTLRLRLTVQTEPMTLIQTPGMISGYPFTEFEFTIPNPAPRHHITLAAKPLPQTNTVGNLRVELIELRCFQRPFLVEVASNLWTCARLRFIENGNPVTNWRIVDAAVVDGATKVPAYVVIHASDPGLVEFRAGFSSQQARTFRFQLRRENRDTDDRFVEFIARPTPAMNRPAQK